MASLNRVQIIGHLGGDPEVKTLPSGDSVANFSVATSESWKDKNSGEQRTLTEWHRINMFGKLAEIAGQYLKKGSQVYIEGSLRTRKWTDQAGVERYTTEIKADTMKMLDKKPEGSSSNGSIGSSAHDYQKAREGSAPAPSGSIDDDIPFN